MICLAVACVTQKHTYENIQYHIIAVRDIYGHHFHDRISCRTMSAHCTSTYAPAAPINQCKSIWTPTENVLQFLGVPFALTNLSSLCQKVHAFAPLANQWVRNQYGNSQNIAWKHRVGSSRSNVSQCQSWRGFKQKNCGQQLVFSLWHILVPTRKSAPAINLSWDSIPETWVIPTNDPNTL